MANGLKHVDIGTQLTKTLWEAEDKHVFDGQAAGDIFYAADGTHLTRLAKSTDGYILSLASGVPIWIPSTHASNHKQGGTDQIDIRRLAVSLPPMVHYYICEPR